MELFCYPMSTVIRKATLDDLTELAPLLDAYRVFYKQDSDLSSGQAFLKARLKKKDSHIFFVQIEGKIAGFVQLYPSFSTVSLKTIYILNDLYVAPSYRGRGLGTALLEYAQEFCVEMGVLGLALETAIDNPAQFLYERMGWEKDVHRFHYFWTAT